MTHDSFLEELSDRLSEMHGGDVLTITKCPGGKWVIVTVSGDGYTVVGHGSSVEEAWENEI